MPRAGTNWVCASDGLTSLPFQVLVTDKPDVAAPNDAAAYTHAAWLAKSHAITVLPSVASLKSRRTAAGKSPAVKPYIAVGNPLLTGPYGSDKHAWDKQACPNSLGQRLLSATQSKRVNLTTRAIIELRRYPKISRAEALQRAMLVLMADTTRPANWLPAAHPAVWASIVVVCEGRP